MARVAPTPIQKTAKGERLWFFCELVVFLESLWFFAVFVVFWSSLWFFGELVVFGRACGSLFQSRDKGQTAKEFDDRVEVVLVTRIGGGYGYD